MKRELPRHSVSVGAVVLRNDGRVLAVRRRDTGAWVTPGGVLELDESPIDGVAREVLEEANIPVRPERLTGVYKNVATGVLSLVFRCYPLDDTIPQSSDEASQTLWMTRDEANDMMAAAFAMRVNDALDDTTTVVRTVAEQNIMAPKPSAATNR